YRIGVSENAAYQPVFSSDYKRYGGTGTPLRTVKAQKVEWHGFEQSVSVTIPPMSTVIYQKQQGTTKRK
ncbi:MAG: hypothetical protein E7399_08005, partial [Ruminococcaceae bacterium]|nr:hypothetical protein [Oscillospiraceae bacterium]